MNDRMIKNAKIESVRLGREGHGIWTAYIDLDYGGCCQSFGGYGLNGGPFMGIFVRRVCEVVGVDAWEDLVGKSVRVDCEWARVYRIGHFLEDRWFDPKSEFAELAAPKEGGES